MVTHDVSRPPPGPIAVAVMAVTSAPGSSKHDAPIAELGRISTGVPARTPVLCPGPRPLREKRLTQMTALI